MNKKTDKGVFVFLISDWDTNSLVVGESPNYTPSSSKSNKHLTLVSPEGRVHFGPARLDSSLPPLPSVGEAQPQLSPAEVKHAFRGQVQVWDQVWDQVQVWSGRDGCCSSLHSPSAPSRRFHRGTRTATSPSPSSAWRWRWWEAPARGGSCPGNTAWPSWLHEGTDLGPTRWRLFADTFTGSQRWHRLLAPPEIAHPPVLTQEVVGREVVGIPDLQCEARRDLVLRLVPGEHWLFLGDDNLLLRHEVIEGVDEAPVEVALSGQGMVVHVCVLLVLLLALQPSGGKDSGV